MSVQEFFLFLNNGNDSCVDVLLVSLLAAIRPFTPGGFKEIICHSCGPSFLYGCSKLFAKTLFQTESYVFGKPNCFLFFNVELCIGRRQ